MCKGIYEQTNILAKDIKDIIKEGGSCPEINKKICERIRTDKVFLKKEYVDKFNDKNAATLDPSQCNLYNNDGLSEILYANSFGPFYPEEYFNKEFRILWILKEDYIKKDSWKNLKNPDRGGHDKADEYKDYNESSTISTYKTIIYTVKKILEKRFCKGIDETIDETEVMKHLCIIELNHFPGLNFKKSYSNDKHLVNWAEINHKLNSVLINFYRPNLVVLNSGIMGSFIEINKNGNEIYEHEIFNWLRIKDNSIKKYQEKYHNDCTFTIAGRELIKIDENHTGTFAESYKNNKGIASAVYDIDSCVWVGLNFHPIRGRCEKQNIHDKKWKNFAEVVVTFLKKLDV
jgi:hypothetical protein